MTIISSGIYPIDPTVTDGTQLAGYINELVEAINSQQASSTRPPMITKGGLWTKTLSGSDIAVMVYDGTNDVEIGKVTGGEIIIGGDSIWTEEDGKAVYDGDIKVNGVTVGRGSGSNDKNTAVGDKSLALNTTGVQNTAVGFHTLTLNTTGTRNTAVGYAALNSITEGEYNTAIGHVAATTLTTGSNNTVIGHNAQPSSPDVSNEVTIGNDDVTKTRLKGDVSVTGGLGVGNIDASAYNLYQSVFRVPDGQGVGITKDNAEHNAYLYFGNGTSIAEQQLASISSKGSNLVLQVGAEEAMTIDGAGDVSVSGRVFADEFRSTTALTVPNVANVHMLPDGTMRKSTATSYSAEEVDKKLAIKDKIIESLSDKLDKLEDILIAKGDLKEKITLNVKDLIAEGEAEFQVYKTKLDEEAKKIQEKAEKAEQEAREKVVAKKKKK